MDVTPRYIVRRVKEYVNINIKIFCVYLTVHPVENLLFLKINPTRNILKHLRIPLQEFALNASFDVDYLNTAG